MTKVCFVANHGVAGDPVFEWLPRVLSSHQDVFVYLGESVRAKHFQERKRNERPPVEAYENFMRDLAGSYLLAVELYSYRAFQIHNVKFACCDTVVVNVIRHPLTWLNYYTSWREQNLNQPLNIDAAIEHEWAVVNHEELSKKGFAYDRATFADGRFTAEFKFKQNGR